MLTATVLYDFATAVRRMGKQAKIKETDAMARTLLNISKVSSVALALGLLAGCATTDEGALRSAIEAADKKATEAQTTANEAKAKAEAAQASANEAKEMAARAEGVAKAAQFAAERNAKKQEEMFKKSMYK